MVTREFIDKMAESLLGERRVSMLLEGREMDLGYMLPGIGRFRCNLFLAMGEVRGVFRHVPERIPAFQELHLPKVLERLSMERRGMILVTGITGSGKSTSLASMIDFMNRSRNDHIVTIEDPIEFVHQDKKCVMSQREIGHDSMNFAQALRAALREDPDIMLVGELRDVETMEVGLHAAETGHLVLSTLHTLNAAETINRMISMFPPHQEDQIRGQLASVIQGIVSQRLVVRADGRGRVPAVEIMIATGLIRDCIREADKTLQLYREELVTYETARDAATNPDDFDLKVKGIFSTGEMTWEHPGGSTTASTHTPPAQPASLSGVAAPAAPAARSPFGKRA